ncbi:toxin-activating lysine-acyltransferase [Agrobacterium cavarae]|uniref:toxin-activating lysine-acyltransferase n=1 Tax=Agrobacterium cavarae TaxID=2528239 RepID=UPI003EE4D0CE
MQAKIENNLLEPKNIRSPETGKAQVNAVGHAVWLMSRSPLHKHLMITDIEWLVTPPIILGQFRLWEKSGNPLAFASWAYLNDEAEERIVTNGIRRLLPTDWKSGDQLWLIDFICPFGDHELVIKELKTLAVPGKGFKMLRALPGGTRSVVEW